LLWRGADVDVPPHTQTGRDRDELACTGLQHETCDKHPKSGSAIKGNGGISHIFSLAWRSEGTSPKFSNALQRYRPGQFSKLQLKASSGTAKLIKRLFLHGLGQKWTLQYQEQRGANFFKRSQADAHI
jgi:hypothetical protein